MRIKDTIKQLRKERGLTQNELAYMLSCNRQKIADWERGKSTPSADDIILLSTKLEVSADYLLGLSEAQTNDKAIQFICDYTGLSEESIKVLRGTKLFKALLDNEDSISGEKNIVENYTDLILAIINQFISRRYLSAFAEYVAAYYAGLKQNILLKKKILKDLQKNGTICNETIKEIQKTTDITDLNLFRAEQLNVDFIKAYTSKESDQLDIVNKHLESIESTINYQLQKGYFDTDEVRKASESYANNSET